MACAVLSLHCLSHVVLAVRQIDGRMCALIGQIVRARLLNPHLRGGNRDGNSGDRGRKGRHDE
jgi:hypothetical protein